MFILGLLQLEKRLAATKTAADAALVELHTFSQKKFHFKQAVYRYTQRFFFLSLPRLVFFCARAIRSICIKLHLVKYVINYMHYKTHTHIASSLEVLAPCFFSVCLYMSSASVDKILFHLTLCLSDFFSPISSVPAVSSCFASCIFNFTVMLVDKVHFLLLLIVLLLHIGLFFCFLKVKFHEIEVGRNWYCWITS